MVDFLRSTYNQTTEERHYGERAKEKEGERGRERVRTAIVLDQSPGFVGEQPPKAATSQPAASLRGEGTFSEESSG